MVLVPHGVRMPAGKIVESESLYERRPDGAALCAEAGQRGLVGRRRDRHRRRQLRQSDRRADVEGPWKHFDRLLAEPFIKGRELTVAVLGDEALCGHRAEAQGRLLRLRRQIYRRPDRACLPGRRCPTNIAAGDDGHGAGGAPAARLQGRVALRFPLGRRAGRGRHLSAGGQHPARNDPLEPGARAGEGSGASATASWSSGSIAEALGSKAKG